MKQRIFAFAAALCLLAAPGAFAQNNNRKPGQTPKQRPTVEQMVQRQTERQAKELGLNETQAKQVYTLNLKQAQQMESHRAQMLKERQAYAAEMKSVLSAEQFDKWSQMQGPKPGAQHGHGKMYKEGKQGCCKQNGKAAKDRNGCGKNTRTK